MPSAGGVHTRHATYSLEVIQEAERLYRQGGVSMNAAPLRGNREEWLKKVGELGGLNCNSSYLI